VASKLYNVDAGAEPYGNNKDGTAGFILW